MTVAHSNLLARAMRLLRGGDAGAADAICRHVIAVDPHNAAALYVAGLVAHQHGDHLRTLDMMDQALAAQPDFADALCARGLARRHLCQPDAATEDFQRALVLNPRLAQAHFYLGLALLEANSLSAAAAKFDEALACDPAMAMAMVNLGLVRQRQGDLDEAARLYRRAIEIQPSLSVARSNLATALQDLGLASEALPLLRCLEAEHPDPVVGANLLACLNLLPGTPQEYCAAAKRWAARFADPLAPAVLRRRSVDPERRLRVGYIGADGLRRHTLAMTYLPLFEAHDPTRVEVFAYSDLRADAEDDVTRRMQAAVATWRRSRMLDDAALAEQIVADEIDILVDGFGFAAGSRLLAAARRPAPIQVHFPIMSTTGMSAFDYVIGDVHLLPDGSEASFTERLWRLDCGFLYRPLDELPPLTPPPLLSNGFVTFGSFNRIAKIGPDSLALWAEVLNAVPDSRLIMRSTGAISEETTRRYHRLFAAHGVAEARIDVRGSMPRDSGALQAFNEIDIALDTAPFGGVLTTCAALAMGVPVVTWAGTRVLERYGAAILTAAGFAEGIAADMKTYVERATALAGAPRELAELRSCLRGMFLASSVCDGPAFARSIEGAYRAMWRRWCAGAETRPAAGSRDTRPSG